MGRKNRKNRQSLDDDWLDDDNEPQPLLSETTKPQITEETKSKKLNKTQLRKLKKEQTQLQYEESIKPKQKSIDNPNDESNELSINTQVIEDNKDDNPTELTRAEIRKMKKKNKKNKQLDQDIELIPEVIVEKPKLSSTFKENNSDETNVSFGNITIVAHNKVLFQDSPLTIAFGHRYGLIGKNGIGKSSLLDQLASRKIPIHPKMDVYYMEQDLPQTDIPVIDTVLMSNQQRYKLLKESERLGELLDDDTIDDDTLDEISEQYSKVMDELTIMGADKDESIVLKILLGLGFTKTQIQNPMKLLSGGWRIRVALAKALYLEPTLLLLDEPTNHLDINATIWLTNYLSKWRKSLVVVSHNQHFLNEICTDIINVENQKLKNYKGNYLKFKSKQYQDMKTIQKNWDELQKKIKSYRRGQFKKDGKKCNFTKADETKLLKDAEKEGIIKPPKDYSVTIQFPEPTKLTRPILETHDVYFEYVPDNPIVKHVDMGIDMDTRMTIVGNNGTGKTTIMNLLTGVLSPTKGLVNRNKSLKIGCYNQHFADTLPSDITPIQHLINQDAELKKEDPKKAEQLMHKYLGSLGLESYAHKIPIESLSGGQKARVVLASIQMEQPHLLFLDEPTNHLDIETVDALIDAINKYKGGVIVISHDMELITKTNCQLWVCKDGTIKEFEGDYEDYYQYILYDIEEPNK
jgi:ATP-binding cassette, subfamily F, member 1